MKIGQAPPSTPFHDYSVAIESAVSWLGSRYLLAAPVQPHRRPNPHRGWYLQSDRWLQASKLRGA
jgi:hypothetical protein